MAYRAKFLVAIISAAIAFYAISGVLFGWSSTRAQQPINDPGAQIRIFESVLQHIENDYVDEPDLAKVRNGAMRGLADGLDPYSSYLTAEQVTEYRNNGNSTKAGIGAEFSQVSSYLYVVSVVKGAPAEKAGLRAGDVIEYIGTKATRDISLYDAQQLIAGETGTKVELRILRSRAKPLTIEVSRGRYVNPQPAVTMINGVAHLKIFSLAKGESSSVRKAVNEVKAKGVNKIVLDLRNVSSGELSEAADVANIFIESGKLATVVGRQEKIIDTVSAVAGKHIFDGEVVALIDLGTAGTGEVIASAIAENKRGEVVGEATFGAGAVQALFTLSGGDGFLLTTAKWASPSGKPFMTTDRETRGVKPTIEVKRPETPEPVEVEEMVEGQDEIEGDEPAVNEIVVPVKQEDIQLKKALELLNAKSKSAGAAN